MQELQDAAEAIARQLYLANDLSFSVTNYAYNGTQVEAGTMDAALIESSLVDRYNNALYDVKNQSYINAQELLMQDADVALSQMSAAVDDLVTATAVLQEVQVVADMTADAVTPEDQQQVTAALNMTDMTVDQAVVDDFNNAVVSIETYANQAAAFISAANNTLITDSIEMFASDSGYTQQAYTGATYQQDIDMLTITFADVYGTAEIGGPVDAYTKSASEIYFEVGYGG